MKFASLLLASVLLLACQSGSITVTGATRPPIPVEEVRIYAEPPPDYEVIAILESAPGRGWSQQAKRDSAIEDLKKKAASLGANGVLITGVSQGGGASTGVGVGVGGGHGGIGVGFGRSSQSVFGKAIVVKSDVQPPK